MAILIINTIYYTICGVLRQPLNQVPTEKQSQQIKQSQTAIKVVSRILCKIGNRCILPFFIINGIIMDVTWNNNGLTLDFSFDKSKGGNRKELVVVGKEKKNPKILHH